MGLIKNFDELAETSARKTVLEVIEEGLASIQPDNIFSEKVKRDGSMLKITGETFNLDDYERVFILGFGKGSARNSKLLEALILDKLTSGFVIDTESEQFAKIEFSKGTHPLPSEVNFTFTQNVMEKLSNLGEKDLVLVVICGGGSAMLVHPHSISLEQQVSVGKALLKSGANITEMNMVRKHLSDVKGGSLARILYPATVTSLIYSDVPGNDLSVIASGPTVKDPTSIEDALSVIKKYGLEKELSLPHEAFVETPQDDKFFERVKNTIILSNLTALDAMQKKAQELGIEAQIFSDKFEDEAKVAGIKLIEQTKENSLLLAGGETTVKVLNKQGVGGRNQEVVLGALEHLEDNIVIASIASDGWDNTENAGAIGDIKTLEQAKQLGIEPKTYLEENNSFEFFEKTGGALKTGRLPANVSDIMVVLRK